MDTYVVPDRDLQSQQEATPPRWSRPAWVEPWDWDDCVQEAYLALVMDHADWTIDAPRTLAWLRRVARNKAVDLRRRLRRHPCETLDERVSLRRDDALREVGGSEQLSGKSPRRPAIAKVRQAIRGLNDRSRAILILHARDGRAYAEIGREFGLTTGQVRSRYNWALHAVQRHISRTSANACVGEPKGGGEQGLLSYSVSRGRRRPYAVNGIAAVLLRISKKTNMALMYGVAPAAGKRTGSGSQSGLDSQVLI